MFALQRSFGVGQKKKKKIFSPDFMAMQLITAGSNCCARWIDFSPKTHQDWAGSGCQPATLWKPGILRPQRNLPSATKVTVWKEAILWHTGLETINQEHSARNSLKLIFFPRTELLLPRVKYSNKCDHFLQGMTPAVQSPMSWVIGVLNQQATWLSVP